MRSPLSYFLLFIFFLSQSSTWAQKRVACIGDSVTKGYGLKDSTQSYPYQLQELLGSDYFVGNFGHSGATLLQHGHNPYQKTQAYKDALAFVPDIIVIALGLNDTDPRNWPNYSNYFFANYTSLINDFKRVNPLVEVYVCKMTPIFSGHTRFLSGTREWFDQIQTLIPQIAKINHAKLIDNHQALSSRIDLFEDNLHPSAAGATILAHNVYEHLVSVERRLQVDKTYGSHMVLQRNVANKIIGLATSNQPIVLEFNKQKYETKANQLGKWEISLPKMREGGPYTIKVAAALDTIVLSDILFGDVYLASGQSNMAFPLQSMQGAKAYLDAVSSQRQIRLFKNKNFVETTHVAWDSNTLAKVNALDFFDGKWERPTLDNVKRFSAIAYVFADEINTSTNVPIGIIDLSVGGSNTESWIPRKTLENDNLLAPYIHSWRSSDFVQDFCKSRAAKNLENTKAKYQRHPYDPAYNFEAGVQLWQNTQLSAVLWYQGESNAHNIEHHAYLFERLVSSWRYSFDQKLPFYFVQLSSINRPSWGAFRDSQRLLATTLPHTYMAVSYDHGDPTDVHPTEKAIVAKRLANLVKQQQYGMKIQAKSPNPIAVKRENGYIWLTFDHCNSLKLSKGQHSVDLVVVDAFGDLIAIQDVEILKNKIKFKEPVTKATYVQYAYSAFTKGNLVSDTDVPVSTFNLKIN